MRNVQALKTEDVHNLAWAKKIARIYTNRCSNGDEETLLKALKIALKESQHD